MLLTDTHRNVAKLWKNEIRGTDLDKRVAYVDATGRIVGFNTTNEP
jgi:hypothetical protein